MGRNPFVRQMDDRQERCSYIWRQIWQRWQCKLGKVKIGDDKHPVNLVNQLLSNQLADIGHVFCERWVKLGLFFHRHLEEIQCFAVEKRCGKRSLA